MNVQSVQRLDLIHVDRRGRRFWARVEGRDGRFLSITPVSKNITYFRIISREVLEHYAHRPRVSTRTIRPGDIVAYQEDGASVHAVVMTRLRARLQVLPIAPLANARELPTRELTDHYARRGRHRT
jgi:hypothetical protein